MKRIIWAFVVVAAVANPLRAGGLDRPRAMAFIEQCRNAPHRQPNLRLIYWRLKVCEAADGPFDAAPYRKHVLGLQNGDGGFGLWPKDASTAEGTLAALKVLRKAGADPADKPGAVRYLQALLAAKAKAAKRYSDLTIQRDVHACLMGLSLLGSDVPGVAEYLKVLEQDGKPWGLYYRITAGRAFNRPLPDREGWIQKIDAQATEGYLQSIWSGQERQYALEAMHLLGGKFTYDHWIRASSYRVRRAPDGPAGLGTLVGMWRTIRTSKLLGVEMPWLAEWLARSASIRPGPTGGFAAMPGLESDPWILPRLARLLPESVPAPNDLAALAAGWRDKQKRGGYYDTRSERSSRWFRESAPLAGRIDDTWQAVGTLLAARAKHKDRKALLAWLGELLRNRRENLGSQDILRVLECFEMLGERPTDAKALAAYFEERFGGDLPATVRALTLLGAKPHLPGAGKRLASMLDRVRVGKVPMELSVLAETVGALDALGEGYPHAAHFLDLLGRVQNADGGVCMPGSLHSNLYDTLAAVRMAKLLPNLAPRSKPPGQP